MSALDDLAQYQSDLVNLLLGDPALAVVPVYKFKDQVVADLSAQSLGPWNTRHGATVQGLAIEVRMPAVRARYSNVPGPQLQVEFTLRILEDPVQNTTTLTCEGVGLEVLQWLDGLILEGGAGHAGITLICDDKNQVLRPVYEYPDRLAYDAVLVAEYPRSKNPRSVLPLLTDDGAGNVTLATTDGAAIYYTLDGSLPLLPIKPDGSLGVVTAPTVLYAAPFAVAAGTVVRWLAWQAGFALSWIGKGTINIP